MVDFLLDNTLGAWHAGKILVANPKAGRNSPGAKTSSAKPSACRVARGLSPLHPRARTGGGSRPLAPSTAGRLRRRNSSASTRAWAAGISWWRYSSGWWPCAWREGKLDEAAAVSAVIRDNLFGLEIDPRCTQIGAFNLALAAWRRVGHRPLPAMNLACSGLAPNTREADWLAIAGDNEKLRNGMDRLYRLFQKASVLGSLINPRAGGGHLLEAAFHKLQPLAGKGAGAGDQGRQRA